MGGEMNAPVFIFDSETLDVIMLWVLFAGFLAWAIWNLFKFRDDGWDE